MAFCYRKFLFVLPFTFHVVSLFDISWGFDLTLSVCVCIVFLFIDGVLHVYV